MSSEEHRIPKKLREVVLWVHPEGRVVGSLFVRAQSFRYAGEERPSEVMNEDRPFIVLKRESPNEVRFYNRSSIIRVEYSEPGRQPVAGAKILPCTLHLMDGSVLEGKVKRALPPAYPRTFDYLNDVEERFIELDMDNDEFILVNKSYILYVTEDAE